MWLDPAFTLTTRIRGRYYFKIIENRIAAAEACVLCRIHHVDAVRPRPRQDRPLLCLPHQSGPPLRHMACLQTTRFPLTHSSTLALLTTPPHHHCTLGSRPSSQSSPSRLGRLNTVTRESGFPAHATASSSSHTTAKLTGLAPRMSQPWSPDEWPGPAPWLPALTPAHSPQLSGLTKLGNTRSIGLRSPYTGRDDHWRRWAKPGCPVCRVWATVHSRGNQSGGVSSSRGDTLRVRWCLRVIAVSSSRLGCGSQGESECVWPGAESRPQGREAPILALPESARGFRHSELQKR
jgi:hypothetical protein